MDGARLGPAGTPTSRGLSMIPVAIESKVLIRGPLKDTYWRFPICNNYNEVLIEAIVDLCGVANLATGWGGNDFQHMTLEPTPTCGRGPFMLLRIRS